ncbi:MAG: class I SAM-dependent methyltransferase [Bacteroidetes bacterium]|nr:class I SAM-dependent methyltransferase [Bacteroidota bacterium]MDA0873932.1 class I SAM-dependent methyltransferase [Bacteroidota bacterium]
MSLIAIKHEDSRRIALLTGLFLIVSLAAGAMTGCWWIPALSVPGFLGLALLVAHYHRAAEEERIFQDQDLQFIQSAIAPVHPLPYFTRWSSSPALAARLIGLIRTHRPQRIVELGSGVSTLVMAYAAREAGAGEVLSLDHDPEYAAITRRNLDAHGLAAHARVVDAPLVGVETSRGRRIWYAASALDDLSGIDLLIVDGPPRKSGPDARWPAFDLLRERLAPGAFVVLDDTARSDEKASLESWSSVALPDGIQQIPGRKGVTILRMPG